MMARETKQQRQFHDDIMDAIAGAHKAGLSPKYMAGFLQDAIKALTTPSLWVAHRKAQARMEGETPWH